jgi:hypothetical protein
LLVDRELHLGVMILLSLQRDNLTVEGAPNPGPRHMVLLGSKDLCRKRHPNCVISY